MKKRICAGKYTAWPLDINLLNLSVGSQQSAVGSPQSAVGNRLKNAKYNEISLKLKTFYPFLLFSLSPQPSAYLLPTFYYLLLFSFSPLLLFSFSLFKTYMQ
jgi:hypothetical protein